MTTQDQFLTLIENASFFERIGRAKAADGMLALTSLDPWGNESAASEADLAIADQMEWLPTSKGQQDPFYPGGIDASSQNETKLQSARSYRIEVCGTVLARLRNIDLSGLKAGPNHFEVPAKGAIGFAFRGAATEIVLGINGKWLEITEYYFQGHWPCGMTEAGLLVVL